MSSSRRLRLGLPAFVVAISPSLPQASQSRFADIVVFALVMILENVATFCVLFHPTFRNGRWGQLTGTNRHDSPRDTLLPHLNLPQQIVSRERHSYLRRYHHP